MKIRTCATLLALALIPPAAAAHPLSAPSGATRGEASVLREHGDASLESLRAGRTATTMAIPADERAALRSAESGSADLLEMRAGEFTEREWTLVLVGALVVLLIILI
jgi:hypothetical protein